jgi:hydroxypyruvate reductase
MGLPRPDQIVAIGKAAGSMVAGVHDHFEGPIPSLVVTKAGHGGHELDAEVLESSHPIPDTRSIEAGGRLREVVAQCSRTDHLLLLVSGGASSLAELPAPGISLSDIADATSHLLAGGAEIHEINRVRREMSLLKGGGLLSGFGGARVTVLAVSDVRGDGITVIGSGIGVVPEELSARSETRIVASNAHARNAVASAAESRGHRVLSNRESLYGDVEAVAAQIARTLAEADSGIHVFGGEPTVVLPSNPGRGGRNQHLALTLSRELAAHSLSALVLVAGTDGTDGPTDDAGGWAAGHLWSRGADHALAVADSGTVLEQTGALFTTGPTGTNVMDVVLALS